MSGRPTASLVTIAVAMPPAIFMLATVILLALGRFGLNPLWPRSDLTLSEAAAYRDGASVALLLESGADPEATYWVRAGALERLGAAKLTPADTAIRADRTGILEILFSHGLRVDASRVRHWHCFARRVGSEESEAFFRSRFPDWTSEPCAATTSDAP